MSGGKALSMRLMKFWRRNMQQAIDFRNDCDALYALIAPLSDDDYDEETGFKGWTINMILRHLYVWNGAAALSLSGDNDAFMAFFAKVSAALQNGSLPDFEGEYLDGLSGKKLLNTWHDDYPKMADAFTAADPKMRVPWAGPSMSARSSITARQMETWAHAQAIYDALGAVRVNTDGIKNIVILGVNTFGWTFKNRREDVPVAMPFLSLTAPSGEVWAFGDDNVDERITGLAEEFCQVVTQVRNIADTDLHIHGDVANRWMSVAQCFAGRPNMPPEPGTRKIATHRN